jgi:ferrous iron transport protein A
LRRGQVAVVSGLLESAAIDSGRDASQSLVTRLRDLGFVPGARCEVVARMWLGGDPIAVRIGGSTFALRRAEGGRGARGNLRQSRSRCRGASGSSAVQPDPGGRASHRWTPQSHRCESRWSAYPTAARPRCSTG